MCPLLRVVINNQTAFPKFLYACQIAAYRFESEDEDGILFTCKYMCQDVTNIFTGELETKWWIIAWKVLA